MMNDRDTPAVGVPVARSVSVGVPVPGPVAETAFVAAPLLVGSRWSEGLAEGAVAAVAFFSRISIAFTTPSMIDSGRAARNLPALRLGDTAGDSQDHVAAARSVDVQDLDRVSYVVMVQELQREAWLSNPKRVRASARAR